MVISGRVLLGSPMVNYRRERPPISLANPVGSKRAGSLGSSTVGNVVFPAVNNGEGLMKVMDVDYGFLFRIDGSIC